MLARIFPPNASMSGMQKYYGYNDDIIRKKSELVKILSKLTDHAFQDCRCFSAEVWHIVWVCVVWVCVV